MEFLEAYFADAKFETLLGFLMLLLLINALKSMYNRPNIPGPYPWPLVGNAPCLGKQPHRAMQAMAKKYGPIYLMKLGSADVVVLNDYDTIKEALERKRSVFAGRPQFSSFANISQGKGIAFNSPLTQGNDWYKMKMTVVRLLHKFIISKDTQAHLIYNTKMEAIQLIRQLDKLCRNSPDGVVKPEPTLHVSMANIICALLWGNRYDYNDKAFRKLINMNLKFGEVVGAGSQIDIMPWIKVFPYFKQTLKTFNSLTDGMNEWMLLRTTEHRKNFTDGITRDLVDTFISESINSPATILKDDVIMALTSDLFGAAQDTLTASLEWMLAYMIYFPDIQKKVQAEIDAVLGNDSLPDLFDIKLFPYTEAVMHEVFRHCSLAALTIPHKTTKETTIKGFYIPKDMLVFVNQFAANRDPRYWDKPDEFRPERFLNHEGHVVPKAHHKYLSFSTGARKCPGDELTRLLFLHLTVVLFNICEFHSDPNKPPSLESVYNLSLNPKEVHTRLLIRKPKLLNKLITDLQM